MVTLMVSILGRRQLKQRSFVIGDWKPFLCFRASNQENPIIDCWGNETKAFIVFIKKNYFRQNWKQACSWNYFIVDEYCFNSWPENESIVEWNRNSKTVFDRFLSCFKVIQWVENKDLTNDSCLRKVGKFFSQNFLVICLIQSKKMDRRTEIYKN